MEPETQTAEIEQLESTALAWPERAEAIAITDQQTYNHAADLIVEIVGLRKQVVDHHKPIKDAAHKAHKVAIAAEKKLLDPLKQAEAILKRAIQGWTWEQEKIRQEEQRRLAEAQRKADEDARLALAVEAETNGATSETVGEILDTPVVTPAIVAPATFQKANGVSTSLRWHAEVTDIKALCLAVAQGRASSNLVQPNLPALNSMARAMKQTFSVPGCKAVSEATEAIRTGA